MTSPQTHLPTLRIPLPPPPQPAPEPTEEYAAFRPPVPPAVPPARVTVRRDRTKLVAGFIAFALLLAALTVTLAVHVAPTQDEFRHDYVIPATPAPAVHTQN